MDAVRKVIKKLRGQYPRPPEPVPLWKIYRAMAIARRENKERWENDKRINREHAFAKAQVALAKYREERQLEKERQQAVVDERLKNLKKARRRQRWLRAHEGDEE